MAHLYIRSVGGEKMNDFSAWRAGKVSRCCKLLLPHVREARSHHEPWEVSPIIIIGNIKDMQVSAKVSDFSVFM